MPPASNGRHWQAQFEQQHHGGYGDGMQDSRGQPLSNAHAPPPPHRPARSVRRPAKQPQEQEQGSSRSGAASAGGDGRAARLAQAIQREERQRDRDRDRASERGGNSTRPGSSLSFRSSSPTGSLDEAQGRASSSRRNGDNRASMHEEEEETDYTTGIARTKKQNDTSPVVEKALAAFGANQPRKAGGKGDGTGISAGSSRNRSAAASGAATPVADASGNDAAGASRSRRGAVGVQGESARARAASALEKVPSTPAFREMERVLAQVAAEWPELLPPGDAVQGDNAEGLGEDAFDPVTLALSLVEPDAPQERFRSFLATKDALSRSLKSSIQTHYHSFDASVSSYNGLLANLTAAQRNTSALRSRLEEVRETLGKNRTELGVLEARRTELNEMDRILIAIESLKSVPDRLETLVSEKRFLNAAVLLMRSLKMINKQDLMEVAAVADLRAYFVSQEALMLEFLTEELHNHLYLKSFYTDTRWKAHVPGQTELPAFLVETAAPSPFDYTDSPPAEDELDETPQRSNQKRQTKLSQYLAQLAQRPSNVPNIDEGVGESVPLDGTLGQSGTTAGSQADGLASMGLSRSGSSTSFNGTGGISASSSVNSGLGIVASSSSGNLDGADGGASAVPGQAPGTSRVNPEQDSFSYIEAILESLAYLGKLGLAMDTVLQRAPLEMYNLVEATVVDVDERNDPMRRDSMRLARFGSSPKLLFSGTFAASNTAAYSLLLRSSMTSSSVSDEASSASLVQLNTEILMDFFWTLFSKLDAVLQGFRVLNDVVQRIVGRREFKDPGMVSAKSGTSFFSLYDVWRPVQCEIQALLHDYLIDEQNGGTSSRSAITSINETLRVGRPVRDPSKSLFKFSETDAKASSRRIKPFEDSLNRSLKASVPGLVSSLAEGTTTGVSSGGAGGSNGAFGTSGSIADSALSTGAGSDSRQSAAVSGRTHRMLVPPNAFALESLVNPTMRFLERAKATLPDGMVTIEAQPTSASMGASAYGGPAARRYSGLLDDETMDRLGPALDAWLKRNAANTNTGISASTSTEKRPVPPIPRSNSSLAPVPS